MPLFDLPEDLVAFLRSGRRLEGVDALFDHDITLLPLDRLEVVFEAIRKGERRGLSPSAGPPGQAQRLAFRIGSEREHRLSARADRHA